MNKMNKDRIFFFFLLCGAVFNVVGSHVLFLTC